MVTIPIADTRQTLLSLIVTLQLTIPRIAEAIQKRRSQGVSIEKIFEEMVANAEPSTEDTSEEKGLHFLLGAVNHFKNNDLDEALNACENARQAWPEIGFVVRFLEGHVLTYMKQYDNAFETFKKTNEELQPTLLLLQSTPDLLPMAEEIKQDFYQRWAIAGIAQGLERLLYSDVVAFEKGAYKYIAVLDKAQQNGESSALQEILSKFKQSDQNGNLRDTVEEFEVGVRLLSIKDPFEGWRALTKEISKVWPEGVSAVDAIGEQRI